MTDIFPNMANGTLPLYQASPNYSSEYTDDHITERTIRFWSTLTGYYMLAVILIGGTLNGAVLSTFRRNKTLINSNNQLLLAIFILDTSMLVSSFPFICVSCLKNRWVFGHFGCQWYGASMTALGLSSIWILTVVAIQRFASIVLVKKSTPSQYTFWRNFKISVAIVIYSVAVSSLPFFGIGKYDLEMYVYSCTPTWWERSTNNIIFIATIFISAFVLPVCVITVCYVGILVKVNSLPLNSTDRKKKIKLALVTIALIGSFLLSWGAYALVAVLFMFKPDFELTPMGNGIPVMLAKSCVLWNPIIYALGNNAFKKALVSDVKKFFGRFRAPWGSSKTYSAPTAV